MKNENIRILKEKQLKMGCKEIDFIDYNYENGQRRLTKIVSKDGGYVGTKQIFKGMARRGIVPELANKQNKVCSIGFCKKEQKWYGWSHRALCGFGIEDMLFKENEYKGGDIPFVKGGKVKIKTLEQAREAAINFADYIS